MKKIHNYSLVLGGLFLSVPVISSAQGLEGVILTINDLIGLVIPLLIAAAVAYFLFGGIKFFVVKDPESQKAARRVIIYGIIVIFVMVSIWGLVELLGATFGIEGGAARVPAVPRPR